MLDSCGVVVVLKDYLGSQWSSVKLGHDYSLGHHLQRSRVQFVQGKPLYNHTQN